MLVKLSTGVSVKLKIYGEEKSRVGSAAKPFTDPVIVAQFCLVMDFFEKKKCATVRRAALLPTYRGFHVDVSTLRQEKSHHVHLPEMAGYVKWCVAGLQDDKREMIKNQFGVVDFYGERCLEMHQTTLSLVAQSLLIFFVQVKIIENLASAWKDAQKKTREKNATLVSGLISARCSTSTSATGTWSSWAARCRGVKPF